MAVEASREDLAAERQLIGRQRRDPEEIRDRLLGWLLQKLPDADSIELPLPVAPPGGGSSESFFVHPIVTRNGEARQLSFVLRIEPGTHRVYQWRTIERQYAVMRTLGELGLAPVPQVPFFEADPAILGDAFMLMEKVEGVVPHDRYHAEGLLKEASPERRRAIWTGMLNVVSGIHGADPAAFQFLARPELGDDAISQELRLWDNYVRWMGVPITPVQQRAQAWLHENRPLQIVPCLSWGDARLPNMIFREDTCRAVLDWESVSLCGAENDLAWIIFYDWFITEAMGVERLEGIPDRDETLHIWSQRSGREPRAMLWHEVAATWRFSLLSDRAMHLAGVERAPFMVGPSPLLARLEELMGGVR